MLWRFVTMSSSESSMFQDNALSILNAFPDPIAVLDSKGTILWCNPATFEVAQMSSEELLGRKFTALSGLSLSNIPKYVKLFASAVAGKEIAPTEVEWKRSDGTTILAEARVSSIRMTDNKRAILVISRDLTPLREAESAISTARDRAQQYLDIAGVIIVALNTEGKATMINRYGCSKLGVPANKVIGKKFFDTFVPKQYREAAREFFYPLTKPRRRRFAGTFLL
jgi:PAS domain S-box-containing protein